MLRLRVFVMAAGAVGLLACSSGSGSAGGIDGGAGTGASGGVGGGGTGGTSGTGAVAGGGTGGGLPAGCVADGAADVCARWNADRQDLDEGAWNGSIAACEPGELTENGRDNALKLVNLYRYLVGLPTVTHDAERNTKAQACSLMMAAEGKLSHTPDPSWACYSDGGAEAAGKSNISTGQGVGAVDRYIRDNGNLTTMGHRRWILSNRLGPIGLGSTTNGSCMWVLGGGQSGNRAWTAWPPPGDVPFEAIDYIAGTGWTIQSDTIDLSAAQVRITDQTGQEFPTTVTQLEGGYGAKQAILIQLAGWEATADNTYVVEVSGASEPICYALHVVNC